MTRFQDLLERIEYKGVTFRIGTDSDGIRQWLQVRHDGMGGRKWLLSEYMTDSEFVATVFKACLTWEEHECREAFHYRGQAVFGPHLNVNALAELLEQGAHALDARDNP